MLGSLDNNPDATQTNDAGHPSGSLDSKYLFLIYAAATGSFATADSFALNSISDSGSANENETETCNPNNVSIP